MSPGPAGHRIFCFGSFEADETGGELRKRGVRVKLHSQPFQVLAMLLEKPSEVVTREEMRQRLWGEGTFVDFDHGLNTAINKIREALGDSASQPRYIETIPGKGYRFIAPVTVRQPVPQIPAPQDPVSLEPQRLFAVSGTTLLSASDELPAASRTLVRSLLLLVQVMYLAFYLAALANLQEIQSIFLEASILTPGTLMTLLLTTAAALIPVRLFILSAVAFDHQQFQSKFNKLFPVLLVLDILWALSPFLLVHHVSTGLALGMSAALVYMPFAQRSLVLMCAHGR